MITSLLAAHVQRGTVASAVMCKWLLQRVVVEVDTNFHSGGRYGGGGGQ